MPSAEAQMRRDLVRARIETLIEESPRLRLLCRALSEAKAMAESKHVSTLGGTPHRDQYARIGAMHLPDAVRARAAAQTHASFLDQKRDFAKQLYQLVGQYQRAHARYVGMKNPTPVEVASWGDRPQRKREHQKRHAVWSRSRVHAKAAEIRDLFRKHYVMAYRKGIGTTISLGHESPALVSQEEARWLESAVRHEARYFNRFMEQIRNGKNPAAYKPRIDRYAASLGSIFRAGQVAGQHPHTAIHWIVDNALENCPDCLELSRRGPYTKESLPTTPKAGATRCLDRCGCRLEYVQLDQAAFERLRVGSKSGTAHLNSFRRRSV